MIVIKGGMIVGRDTGPVDILVREGRIAAIGPEFDIDGIDIIDARGGIVIPGMVDTHRHLWQTSIRGVAADWSLAEYIREIRFGYALAYEAEDIYIATLCGALEALQAGVTTVCDFSHCLNSPEHSDAAVQALRDAGIRARFAYGFYAPPVEKPVFASHSDRLVDARRIRAQHFSGNTGLVTMGIALTEQWGVQGADQSSAFACIYDEIALARQLDLPITLHTGAMSARGVIERFHKEGLLCSDMLCVHCNFLKDSELRLLADAGAHVSATPETEMQMGMGFPVINRALAAGLKPTLGVDIVSDCSGDLFNQMRLGLQAARAIDNQSYLDSGGQPATLSLRAADVLDFATVNGAEALGLGARIGRIAPGADADIVVIRSDGFNLAPAVASPAATTVLQSCAGDVETVLVAGRVIKRRRQLVRADAVELRRRLAASAERIGARTHALQERVKANAHLYADPVIAGVSAKVEG